MESQLVQHPNEDMIMSYAPSFSAPGGHIFDVVDQKLVKHVFQAMLAQHVASELRMNFWPWRSLTDRNRPLRMKIDLVQSGYNGIFRYNGYNGFLLFLPFFDMFEDEKNLDTIQIRCAVLGIGMVHEKKTLF